MKPVKMRWIRSTVENVERGEIYYLKKRGGNAYIKGKQRCFNSAWYNNWNDTKSCTVEVWFSKPCWVER